MMCTSKVRYRVGKYYLDKDYNEHVLYCFYAEHVETIMWNDSTSLWITYKGKHIILHNTGKDDRTCIHIEPVIYNDWNM